MKNKQFIALIFFTVTIFCTEAFSQACFTPYNAVTIYSVGAGASYNNRNYTNRYGINGGRPDLNSTFSYDNWIDAGACASCNAVNPGSIGSAQSILTNTAPTPFTNISAASGGNGSSYTYQWQISTTNTTWTDISGANSTTFSPGVLTVNTYFRRKASSCTEVGFTSSILIKVVLPIDSDGDGILDHIDLDDDNDGILDTQECGVSNFGWSSLPNVSGNTATGNIFSINYSYTSSTSVQTTPNVFNHGIFPASYGIPNTTSIQNLDVNTNTLSFSQPVLNPVLIFSSIGGPGLSVPIVFNKSVEVLWSSAVVINSSTQITGTEGYAIVRVNGIHSSVSFDYLVAEGYANFMFGADLSTQTTCDTDADGIDNTLDLDSDGDGCADAIEGGGTFTGTNLTNDRLSGSVDANGVPVIATASGQTVGTSQLVAVSDAACPPCPDNDSDGVCNNIDLDDDNDGILDTNECPATLTNLVQNGNFESGNTGFTSDYSYTSSMAVPNQFFIGSQGANLYAPCTDYTSGTVSGKMIIADGSTTTGTRIFCQNINVTQNTNYQIGFWAANAGNPTDNPAQLRATINSVTLGSSITLPSPTCNWVNFTQTYNSGTNTSVQFCIIDDNVIINGNNFLLDDISFTAPSLCDTDNDGVINSLDTDSDADGCVDAIEGGAAFTTASLTGNRLSGSVNSQGVPVIASASGQTVGTSQNVNVKDAACPACPDNNADGVCDTTKLCVGSTVTATISLSPTWSPSDLGSSLSLWLDANDASTLTTSGGLVSQWNDKSGNGRHVTQSTVANQPTYTSNGLNGKPVISFDGNDDFLRGLYGNIGTTYYLFAVTKPRVTTPSQKGAPIGFESSDGVIFNSFVYDEYTAGKWHNGSSGFIRTPNLVSSVTENNPPNPVILELEVLPSAQKLYRNGTIVASSSYTWPSISGAYSLLGKRHTGGGTPHFDGMDAEIILSTSLTDCDRQKLEGYLANKWGLTANLPSNHLYITSTSTGTWTSANPAVATINNSGVITGVSAGTATFTFTNTATGCSFTTNPIVVNINAPCLSPTPIALLYFNAVYNDASKTVLLKWSTATETNNDYFTIERSVNGQDWQILSIKKGAGNSSQTLVYETRDISPLPDISYYRLKQTDFNGQFTYSSIVSVFGKDIDINYSIHPNPASDFLTIHPSTNIDYAEVVNSLGIIVLTTEVFTSVSISELPVGFYFVTIHNTEKEVFTQKIIINR